MQLMVSRFLCLGYLGRLGAQVATYCTCSLWLAGFYVYRIPVGMGAQLAKAIRLARILVRYPPYLGYLGGLGVQVAKTVGYQESQSQVPLIVSDTCEGVVRCSGSQSYR